jgi:hypothetical protein
MNAPSPPLAPMATRARPYRVSLHWDAREQSLQSYAATTLDVLDFLTARSDVFERWFIRGDGLSPFEKDRTRQLELELETNVRTWEFNGVEYSGHQAKLSNGRRGSRQLELDLACGIRAPSTWIWFANQVHVELFGPSEGFPDLASLEALVGQLLEDFQPAWAAVFTPNTPDRSLEDLYHGVPHVGWYTVFAPEPEYGPLPSIDLAIRTLPTGQRIVRCVDTWFDDQNPEHLERRERTAHALASAGLLRPRV